ncbi:DUF1769-domain-containing protein [Aulographum hederae CBS 113979]|uniref:DUF1769-domain-containing protein n=1 Tax=Aulographum hederae CBS 113979 TaxID=1176131 RepID=A0A6G1H619_9PEZI|nr:DUF1769-domain-containing protein [Aulographum hederae CBS 113979]
MASLVKNKLSDTIHGTDSDSINADKYQLLVTAGPSYSPCTQQPVHVNTSTPTVFENEFMKVAVKVRIQEFRGLPRGSPSSSPYFEDPRREKDRYSVSFTFVPKKDIPLGGEGETVWGNDFDHPVRDRLPPGVNTAIKIVKELIDPGITCDAYADEPWLYTPALAGWDAFRIGEKVSVDDELPYDEEVFDEGADGEGEDVRKSLGIPDGRDKRRKFFLNKENQKAFLFEKGRVYRGDFFNPYLDFGKFALRLPGFSLSVGRYINDKTHALRYVFKNTKTGDVYFVIVMNLLFGDELEKALHERPGQ